MTARARLLVLTAALCVALAGCGSRTTLLHTSKHASATSSAPGVPNGVVRVIVGWADALRAGHVAAAARYFQIPSVFFSGGPPIEMRSLSQVESVNSGLPCGAKFLSARVRGRLINVLFRLTNRPGPGGAAGCGAGTGQTARTNFLIRNGHIVEWLRAPDEPGDNGTPKTPQAQPPSQTTPAPAESAPSQQI
jgi:hypothetical protein